MLYSKRSPLASTSTSTPTPQPSRPTAPEKASLTSTHTTPSPHHSTYHSKDNINIDRNNSDSTQTTDTAKALLYARVHGAILAGFIWSVWCCDHYRVTPFVTIPILFTGALYFLCWYRHSSITVSSLSSSPRPFSSKLTDNIVTYPTGATREEGGGGTQDQVGSGPSPSSLSPSTSALASDAAASVSACSVSSAITISVLAAQNHHNNSNNSSSMGMSMPPTPTDPPPPYYHNNSTNESGSDSLANSSSDSNSRQCMQLQLTTARSRLQQQQFSRMRLVIHVWGAGASLLGLVSWTIASRPESLLLSWLSPILEAEELLLLVPFSLWCWIVVTFVWVLYAVATFLLLSRGILTRYLDVDVDGAGSGVATSNEQQPLIKEVTVSSINKEEEMEQKKKQAERTEQESCVKKVDTEDLSDIGQDKDRAQQQIVTEAPSLRLLCRSASCRQAVDRSSYKGGNSDAIMIKRYRRGPTTTPTKTAHKTWTTSMSLLQQVKHEIQFWSFSLWVLAPTIPRSFDHHHHRPQQQPQQHSTSSNDGKDIHSLAPRHPQQYGPIEKHESLLLTASSSVPCDNMDESEYDMVLSDEASELDRHLASTDVVVATKTEEDEGRRRSQDRQDGGNPGPIQDDGISGSQSVILQTENQPSFGQLQRHSPPTRSGYMSQSMPDLHAVKSTMGPSPVESTLARWSRMTLDSERLGSIFQYYLRQRASTLKRERHTDGYGDHDDQDPTTSDDLHDDASSNNDISNNDDDDDDGAHPGVTFVIRSSTLPTVRVGLYSADQKRFWTSSGPTHLSPLPESYD